MIIFQIGLKPLPTGKTSIGKLKKARDDSDPPMSQGDEILYDLVCRSVVVNADKVDLGVEWRIVEEDEAEAAFFEALQVKMAEI